MQRGSFGAAVLALSVLLALACGGPPPQGGARVEPGQPSAGEPAAPAPKIGDLITFPNDSEWVVDEAKDLGKTAKSNNQFQENLSTEGRYVLVKFSVKNLGPKEIRVFSQPEAIDSQGRKFKTVDSATFFIPKDGKTLALEGVGPGLKKSFYTLYELPPDATAIKMEVWEAHKPFAADTKAVDLGL